MTIYFRKIIPLYFFVSIIFLSFSCKSNQEEVYQLKNGLIYKYGNDKPYTGKVKDTFMEYDVLKGKENGKFNLKYSNVNIKIDGQ